MPHRHAPPTRSGPAIVALALVLLVIAGGVLGAAYYFVLREEDKPAVPPEVEIGLNVPDQVIPFDRPTVDERTGAWILEFEAQKPWREPGVIEAVLQRARDCRDFVSDGRFAHLYPEAPKSVRLRIICTRPLRGETGDRLRAGLAEIEGIEIELRGLDPAEFR